MKYTNLAKEFFSETEENGMSNFSTQRRLAIREFAAWLDSRPTKRALNLCQCGEDCIPMFGEDTCVRCDLVIGTSQ